jgi:ComF family protein
VGATPGLPCARCQRDEPTFAATTAALEYRSPTDRLIASFKYRQGLHLAVPLAGCLVETLIRQRRPSDAWPRQLVPVPMPPERLRQRGFNQASELARLVGKALSIPVNSRLVNRPGATTTQRGLSRAGRAANVQDAFVVRHPPAQHIAVVDDVMTTGATAESISQALCAAGTTKLEIWVVARTPQASAPQS